MTKYRIHVESYANGVQRITVERRVRLLSDWQVYCGGHGGQTLWGVPQYAEAYRFPDEQNAEDFIDAKLAERAARRRTGSTYRRYP